MHFLLFFTEKSKKWIKNLRNFWIFEIGYVLIFLSKTEKVKRYPDFYEKKYDPKKLQDALFYAIFEILKLEAYSYFCRFRKKVKRYLDFYETAKIGVYNQ